jgi:phage gp36-like protein
VTFDTTTKVTAAQVTQMIDEADAQIDATIGQKYEVPVTAGTSALNLLKRISVWLVISEIAPIFEVKTGGDSKAEQKPGRDEYKKANDILSKIASGEITLDGATQLGSHAGVKSYVSENDLEPTFQKDEDQW